MGSVQGAWKPVTPMGVYSSTGVSQTVHSTMLASAVSGKASAYGVLEVVVDPEVFVDPEVVVDPDVVDAGLTVV